MDFLERIYLMNSVRHWLLALGTALIIFILFKVIQGILFHWLASLFPKSRASELSARLTRKTKPVILIIWSLYIGTLFLTLSPRVTTWARTLTLITFFVQVGIWSDALISFWLSRYQEEHVEEKADQVTTYTALGFIIRLALFSLLILLALDNIPGVEATTLITSLGIGGIAVALAVQSILTDLFASLSISLDKPFVIGDLISVGEFRGKVENIGLKTTRISSLSGEQIVISNSDLLSSRIRNYRHMTQRRVTLTVGVAAETPYEKMLRIPNILEEIISAQEDVRFDRAHFSNYGDFSLDFDVLYHVLNANFSKYMETKQNINLEILRRFKEEGITMPYPTQHIYLTKE
ncbi:MAG: mechanosensitive ion channel family protein [Anaerolineales bacterium]